MDIDIIDMTAEEYDSLNAVQVAMVRTAQLKKNEVLDEAAKEKLEIRQLLLSNNTRRSNLYGAECERIDAETEKKVGKIRDDLDHQLAYEVIQSEGNDKGPYRYPENPNFHLGASQRFIVVRYYYMRIEDAETRLQAYSTDTLARVYLGEFYDTLYDILAAYCA